VELGAEAGARSCSYKLELYTVELFELILGGGTRARRWSHGIWTRSSSLELEWEVTRNAKGW